MRFITETEPGVVELRWMWLPTFIGMGTVFKQELEKEVAPMLVGKGASDEVLDAAHEKIIELLCKRFPIPGLKDYLDALKFVQG
jgi:hypothetical protein